MIIKKLYIGLLLGAVLGMQAADDCKDVPAEFPVFSACGPIFRISEALLANACPQALSKSQQEDMKDASNSDKILYDQLMRVPLQAPDVSSSQVLPSTVTPGLSYVSEIYNSYDILPKLLGRGLMFPDFSDIPNMNLVAPAVRKIYVTGYKCEQGGKTTYVRNSVAIKLVNGLTIAPSYKGGMVIYKGPHKVFPC